MEPRVLNAITRPGPEANLHTVRASIEVNSLAIPEVGVTGSLVHWFTWMYILPN